MDRQPFSFIYLSLVNHFYFPSQIRRVNIQKKNISIRYVLSNSFEPKAGLEPATYSLRMNCSTN